MEGRSSLQKGTFSHQKKYPNIRRASIRKALGAAAVRRTKFKRNMLAG